jgi:hypothetical protein
MPNGVSLSYSVSVEYVSNKSERGSTGLARCGPWESRLKLTRTVNKIFAPKCLSMTKKHVKYIHDTSTNECRNFYILYHECFQHVFIEVVMHLFLRLRFVLCIWCRSAAVVSQFGIVLNLTIWQSCPRVVSATLICQLWNPKRYSFDKC